MAHLYNFYETSDLWLLLKDFLSSAFYLNSYPLTQAIPLLCQLIQLGLWTLDYSNLPESTTILLGTAP